MKFVFSLLFALFISHNAYADASLRGVHPQLAAKARQLQSMCGSRVISGVRHTRIAGSRHMSLHASGRAVDMAGNPSCMYSLLKRWPGGYTTDYGRMQHIHISIGGYEHGLRFAHGQYTRSARRINRSYKYACRYCHQRHHYGRYARAN